jgi:hypothetical protein
MPISQRKVSMVRPPQTREKIFCIWVPQFTNICACIAMVMMVMAEVKPWHTFTLGLEIFVKVCLNIEPLRSVRFLWIKIFFGPFHVVFQGPPCRHGADL